MTEDNWTNPLSGDSGTVPFLRTQTKPEGITSISVATDVASEEVKPESIASPSKRGLKERCYRRGPRGKR